MPSFSSHLHYEVAADGTAVLTETRTVVNETATPFEISHYEEMLPAAANLSTYRAEVLRGNNVVATLNTLASVVPGTERHRIRMPRSGDPPIVCHPGDTLLRTTCTLSRFYDHQADGVYFFHFHHRIPDLPYLKGQLIEKTVTVNIVKPARVFSRWTLAAIHEPVGDYRKYLTSFSPNILLRFDLKLGDNQYYANAVALIRHSRKIPIAPLLKLGGELFKKKVSPA